LSPSGDRFSTFNNFLDASKNNEECIGVIVCIWGATVKLELVFIPQHTSRLNQIEIIFGIIKRGNFTSLPELKSRLKQFIDYFNRALPSLWKRPQTYPCQTLGDRIGKTGRFSLWWHNNS
jgi:hypothetical protein